MRHKVTLYTKEGCSLCSDAKAILGKLRGEFDLQIAEKDITADPQLYERFKNVIPVVEIEGKATFLAPISEFRLRQALED